jgi:hypothetical protein
VSESGTVPSLKLGGELPPVFTTTFLQVLPPLFCNFTTTFLQFYRHFFTATFLLPLFYFKLVVNNHLYFTDLPPALPTNYCT